MDFNIDLKIGSAPAHHTTLSDFLRVNSHDDEIDGSAISAALARGEAYDGVSGWARFTITLSR